MIPFFLSCVAWAIYALPRRIQLALGGALGSLLRQVGMRSRVVRQNLAYAFPENDAEQKRVLEGGYRHLGNLILEILFLFGPMWRFALRSAQIEGVENWRQAKAQGKGVIFLSSHVGNWEVMAAAGVIQMPGLSLMLVTKHLKPEWLHQAVEKSRARCGVLATYEPKTLRDVLAHLKNGDTVGFILDQYAGPPVGVRVPVFGVPVGTMSAVAMLAKRTGAPVLPVVNYRAPDGTYKIKIRPALSFSESEKGDELAVNTARYAQVLERDIYDHPEQWLWTHRRFKGDLSPLREGEWSESRTRR